MRMHRNPRSDEIKSTGEQSSKSRALRGHVCCFLPPSRNVAFGVKTFSFFSSPEDNASVCHSEVPIDPFGRMLESSYSSPRAFVNTEGRWLHTAAESSPEFGIFAH